MNYDESNIFAKILRNEVPCYKVYEDDKTLAFMDVSPQANGHVLVVPKSASRNLLDASADSLASAIVVAQDIARACKSAFDADGVTLVQFNETAAGQTVFHLHFHIIPRYEGVTLRDHHGKMEDGVLLQKNADLIKKHMESYLK